MGSIFNSHIQVVTDESTPLMQSSTSSDRDKLRALTLTNLTGNLQT